MLLLPGSIDILARERQVALERGAALSRARSTANPAKSNGSARFLSLRLMTLHLVWLLERG